MYDKKYCEQIIEEIVHDDKINYIAFAITKFHAIGVMSSIQYLKSEGIHLNGKIYIGEHAITGCHLQKEDFLFDDSISNISVCFGESTFRLRRGLIPKYNSYFSRIIKSYRRVYIVCVNPLFGLVEELKKYGIECVLICIDDGTATYLNPYIASLQYCETQRKNNELSHIIYKGVSLLKTCLITRRKKQFINNNRLIEFYLFHECDGMLKRNDKYAKFYLEALKMHNKAEDIEQLHSCILINTQCFKECNLTDGIVDLILYKKAINIIKKYNSNIVIKPHPREVGYAKYSEMNCVVLEKVNNTQEEMLASLDSNDLPKCIISVSSSTLLNASGIFGIPAISLAKIFQNEDISSGMRDNNNDYIKQYANMIQIPNNFEEFEQLIKLYCHD